MIEIKGYKFKRRIKMISPTKCAIQFKHNHFLGGLLLGWWTYDDGIFDDVGLAIKRIKILTEEDCNYPIVNIV